MSNNVLDFTCTQRQYKAVVQYEKILLIDEVSGKRTVYRRTKKKKDGLKNPIYPNVKIYASKKGIILKDVAEILGENYAGLCSQLNGTRKIKAELKPRIAELLGVSEEVLFGGKE